MARLRQIFRVGLFVTAIVGLAVYIKLNPSIWRNLSYFSLWSTFLLALSYVVAHVVNATILRTALKFKYAPIPMIDAMGINIGSSLAGYLTPFRLGGVGSRVLLLKLRFGVAPIDAVGQFLAVTLMTVGVSGAVFSGMVWWSGDELANEFSFLAIISAVASIASLVCYLLVRSRGKFLSSSCLAKGIARMAGAVDVGGAHGHAAMLFLLVAASFALQVVQTELLLVAVGIGSNIAFSLLVCAVANLMLVFSFTPGNIGVKELLLGGLAYKLGIDENAFVASLLVDRAVQLFVLIVGTICLANWSGFSPVRKK